MKIALLDDSTLDAYDRLASAHGTVFNGLRWLGLFGDRIQLLGIFDDDDTLVGGFHLYREKRFGIAIYRNAPFTPTCGPFMKISAQNPVSIMDVWKKTISLIAEYIDGLRCPVLSISLDRRLTDMQPFIWARNKVVPGYTYIIDLGHPLETIVKNMSSRQRCDINAAERLGVNIEPTGDYAIVRAMVERTFSKKGKSLDARLLDAILFDFADGSNSFAFVASKDGRPAAVLFCIFDRICAYYLLGGAMGGNANRSAGPSACWAGIRYSKEIGLRFFDFEGSMIPEVEKFFRGFGGSLTPYFRVNKARLPLEMALKLWKRELF